LDLHTFIYLSFVHKTGTGTYTREQGWKLLEGIRRKTLLTKQKLNDNKF
jgi:hypothetical protein